METQNKLEIHHVAKRLPYGLKYKLPISSERMCDYIEGYYWSFVHTLETAIETKIEEAIELNNTVLSQKNPFIAIEDNEIFIGQMDSNLGFDVDDVFLKEVQPILFPLSSLTETITIKGNTFCPIDELNKRFKSLGLCKLNHHKSEHTNHSLLLDTKVEGYNLLSIYKEVEKLLEWHFDLPSENLIEKGLAISVFDLEQNPYKK